MTTMTRGKKLFVLLLALVILTGVTLLVAHLVPDEDESTAEDTSYIIFSLDPDQVTQLSWTYEDSTVTLTKDENSNWSYPDDEAFPLDASYPDAMVQALKEVSATKTIESPENLAGYGLEEAACAISVTAGDSTYELRIGDDTGLGGGSVTSPWGTATSTWWMPTFWRTSLWGCMISYPWSPSPL